MTNRGRAVHSTYQAYDVLDQIEEGTRSASDADYIVYMGDVVTGGGGKTHEARAVGGYQQGDETSMSPGYPYKTQCKLSGCTNKVREPAPRPGTKAKYDHLVKEGKQKEFKVATSVCDSCWNTLVENDVEKKCSCDNDETWVFKPKVPDSRKKSGSKPKGPRKARAGKAVKEDKPEQAAQEETTSGPTSREMNMLRMGMQMGQQSSPMQLGQQMVSYGQNQPQVAPGTQSRQQQADSGKSQELSAEDRALYDRMMESHGGTAGL